MQKYICDICGDEIEYPRENMIDGKLITSTNNNRLPPESELRIFIVDKNAGQTTFATENVDLCIKCLKSIL